MSKPRAKGPTKAQLDAEERLREYRPYNPLAKENLGESVYKKLLEQRLQPLPTPRPLDASGKRTGERDNPFVGAGVYAIYYLGKVKPYPHYAPIALDDPDDPDAVAAARPIYVGKADPPGSRSGDSLTADPKFALYDRLRQHAESIDWADNLDVDDFRCLYLAVDDAYIGLGEIVVIQKTGPLWNKIGQGFGSKVVGEGRTKQKRSRWDTLHGGRPGVGGEPPKLPEDQLVELIRLELAGEIDLPAEADDPEAEEGEEDDDDAVDA